MKDVLNPNGKMTSLEIAELTGKRHHDVMRDIRKMEEAWERIGQSKFALSSYINSQNRAMPMYELTKTECLYIATKFHDEARATLVLRWEELERSKSHSLSPAEQLLHNAQLLVEQERKLNEHDSRIARLEAQTTVVPDYFSIAGYGRLNGIHVSVTVAAQLGRKATKMCKIRGHMVDQTTHPLFGVVNMYPSNILEELFQKELV